MRHLAEVDIWFPAVNINRPEDLECLKSGMVVTLVRLLDAEEVREVCAQYAQEGCEQGQGVGELCKEHGD